MRAKGTNARGADKEIHTSRSLSIEEVESLLQAHAEVRLGQVLADGYLTIEEYHQLYKVLDSRVVIQLLRNYETGPSTRR